MCDRPRWILSALLTACGPAVENANSAGGDGGDSSGSGTEGADTTGPGASSTSATTTTGTTGVTSVSAGPTGDEAEAEVGPGIFDLAVGDLPPDTGEPPQQCDLPLQPNSDVSGATPVGDRTFTAAAFAEVGGGKCAPGVDVVIAVDTASLANAIAEVTAGDVTSAAVVELEAPDYVFQSGTWTGMITVEGLMSAVTAEVTVVPDLESPAPLLQLELTATDAEWTLSGPVTAHYCSELSSGPCGAFGN